MQHSAAMAGRLKYFPNPGGLSLETLSVWKAVVDMEGRGSQNITRAALSKLTPFSLEKCLPRIVKAGLLEFSGRRYSLTPKGFKWSALALDFKRRPTRAFGRMGHGDAQVMAILASAKRLARRYRELTGRPLGVTGEVAEYEAVSLLGLELAPVRTAGYDVVERIGSRRRRLQVKGRCLLPGCKPSQRLGKIDVDKPWDAVLLVLLDGKFNATAIYDAPRRKVCAALAAPGSKSRNERGALSVSKFKSIATLRWTRNAALLTHRALA
jgi:hypothetical protein